MVKKRQYPEGWDAIKDTVEGFEVQLKEVVHEPDEPNKRKWLPILKISHQKSRYIYNLFNRQQLSKELYEYCLDKRYANRKLIAKWKKPGYEHLCCLGCIETRNHNFGTTCICRVPRSERDVKVLECHHCGCKGCASGD